MAVTILNLLQGPVDVWTAVFGTAEMASNATAPTGGWSNAGGTDGGFTVAVNQSYSMMTVDQVAGPVDARFLDLDARINGVLAEATLVNYRLAFNQAASANTYVEIDPTIKNQSPSYLAVLLRGTRPGLGGPRSVYLRRGLSVENVQSAHQKDGKTMIPVTWQGLYVSQSIMPIRIDDTP